MVVTSIYNSIDLDTTNLENANKQKISNDKILVGVSGGVDSAVALYLLQQKGCEVTAATMEIYKGKALAGAISSRSCYGAEKQDIPEIKAMCDKLGVPFYVFDVSQEFQRTITAYFKEEYLKGHTPNPCIKCNALIKFDQLPKKAKNNGLDFVAFATGHYARIIKRKWQGGAERYYLARPKDLSRDQTYFLWKLSQEQLAKTIFPLGELTKDEVREFARQLLGKIGDKRDSQDFYGGDYNDILAIPPRKGEILLAGENNKNKVLGYHKGFWNYTLGQRKGLGVSYPTPLYVVDIDNIHNRIFLAEKAQAFTTMIQVKDFSLYPLQNSNATMFAKVRSSGNMLKIKDIIQQDKEGIMQIIFNEETLLPAPEQSVVIYQEDMVIGGGTILPSSYIKS